MRLVARREGVTGAGLFDVSENEARDLNLKGFAILTPVNEIPSGFKLEDVTRVKYWFCECDYKGGRKPELDLVLKQFIWPSKVVETKAGYHIYWKAKDASRERYRLVQDRLTYFYGGDKNARNINRFLRAPGFYHVKDLAHPFLCKLVYECEAEYREELMLNVLPKTPDELKVVDDLLKGPKPSFKASSSFVEWIDSQNQMQLLTSLSGHSLVSGDVFKFEPISGGKFNSYTNGKQSSWWIDSDGRIGSASGGGPTVIQFCMWYGRSFKQVINDLERFFK